jgi:hypothetical protein
MAPRHKLSTDGLQLLAFAAITQYMGNGPTHALQNRATMS